MPLSTTLLTGGRVYLASLTDDDIHTVLAWYQDPIFLQLYDARPAAPRTADALRSEIQESLQANNTYLFAIKLKSDDSCIGIVELDGILWAHGVSGLGIAIGDPALQGQGYGTEAGQLGLQFAFEELNLHRLTATVFDYNTASLRLCEKLGFKQEGAFREFLQRGGQRHDMILHGLLRHEWEAAR